MRVALFVTCLGVLPAFAFASDTSVFGTHWVKFQPIQVAGELQGCQLTFLTVTADRVYLNGNQVAVNGSIVLRSTDRTLGLMLKIGLKDVFAPAAAFERPAFAYLQTSSASTARARQEAQDGDPGYKLFVYNALDDGPRSVLLDLLSKGSASLGYARRSGGMDVLVPLDLFVTDSEYTEDQKVIRTRSLDTVAGFAECAQQVLRSVAGPTQ